MKHFTVALSYSAQFAKLNSAASARLAVHENATEKAGRQALSDFQLE